MRATRNIAFPKRSNRDKVALSCGLEARLLAYAIVGGSLAIAPEPANAQIIYTPSNLSLAEPGFGQHVFTNLDINNDGVTDFRFAAFYYTRCSWVSGAQSCWASRSLISKPLQSGNGEIGSPLSKGVQVGSSENFDSGSVVMARSSSSFDAFHKSKSFVRGLWQGIQYAYVGLKFVANGDVHYGWARIKFDYPTSVSPGKHQVQGMFTGTIIGYAYQATPNQPIITGQTSDDNHAALSNPEIPANSHPLDLGLLAAGSQALSVRRNSMSANLATGTK